MLARRMQEQHSAITSDQKKRHYPTQFPEAGSAEEAKAGTRRVCVCVRAWGWSREGSRDMGTATRSQSGGLDQCRGTNSHRAKQLHQPSEEQEVLIYPTLASDGLGAWKGSSWPWSTSDHISLGWAHGRSYRIPQ